MAQMTCGQCGKTVQYLEDMRGVLSCPSCGGMLADFAVRPGTAPPGPSTALTAQPPLPRVTGTPYPGNDLGRSLALEAPTYQLTSPGMIGLATFLGGPLAGFLLMARNNSQRGHRAGWWWMVLAGIVVTVGVLALCLILPDTAPGLNLVIAVPSWLGTYLVARLLQGPLFERHQAQGGAQSSGGVVVGYVALGLVLTFVPFCAGVGLYEVALGDQELKVSANEEVYYARNISEGEAKTLGKTLQEQRFFNGIGEKSVRFSKDGETYVVQVVLAFGFDDTPTHEQMRKTAEGISRAFGGKPVRIDLCDMFLTVKKKLPVVRAPATTQPRSEPKEGPFMEPGKEKDDKKE